MSRIAIDMPPGSLSQVCAAGQPVGHGDELRELAVGGDHYLSDSHPLTRGDDARLVLLDSYDRALAPYRTLRSRILLLSGLATLLAVGVAVALGRGISLPVSRLAQAAQRIQAGDYSQAPVTGGSREIVELAGAFGRMQADIAAREERILHQAHHDGLTGLPNRRHAYDRLRAAAFDTRMAETGFLNLFGQLLRHQAGIQIGGATGRKWHDDFDRAIGEVRCTILGHRRPHRHCRARRGSQGRTAARQHVTKRTTVNHGTLLKGFGGTRCAGKAHSLCALSIDDCAQSQT